MQNKYKNIDGWAQEEHQGKLFDELFAKLRGVDPVRIAEVGVYKGRLTMLVSEILADKGICAEYHCVDHFKGSAEHEKKDYYPEFNKNINEVFLGDIEMVIHVSDSLVAAKNFPDEYFDIVYIDASHDYESVKKDIIAWLPKVKVHGFLCGDDYMAGWEGVIQAVNELLGKDKFRIIGGNQWFFQKPLL